MTIDLRTPIEVDTNSPLTDPYDGADFDEGVESKMDLAKIDNIEFDDVDMNDYPDFSDAYISAADYDGEPMDDDQLAELNENYPDFVHEKLINQLY